jgi:hypothetical protein
MIHLCFAGFEKADLPRETQSVMTEIPAESALRNGQTAFSLFNRRFIESGARSEVE